MADQLTTIAKMLRIALSYDSREKRIEALLNSPDLDVAMLARVLRYNGLLNKAGIVDLAHKH